MTTESPNLLYFANLKLTTDTFKTVIAYRSINKITYDNQSCKLHINDSEFSVDSEVAGMITHNYETWCSRMDGQGITASVIEKEVGKVVELSEKLLSMISDLEIRTKPLCDISDKYSVMLSEE